MEVVDRDHAMTIHRARWRALAPVGIAAVVQRATTAGNAAAATTGVAATATAAEAAVAGTATAVSAVRQSAAARLGRAAFSSAGAEVRKAAFAEVAVRGSVPRPSTATRAVARDPRTAAAIGT